MKILVAYYSRTGNTKKVAQTISKNLECDIDEIVDLKDRTRKIIGWLIAGKDASTKSSTTIEYKKNPTDYDLVVIGTPVWSWTLTPAIRTYLRENELKRVAFFCTNRGNKGNFFEEMKKMSSEPVATLETLDRNIDSSKFQGEIKEFCKKLK